MKNYITKIIISNIDVIIKLSKSVNKHNKAWYKYIRL